METKVKSSQRNCFTCGEDSAFSAVYDKLNEFDALIQNFGNVKTSSYDDALTTPHTSTAQQAYNRLCANDTTLQQWLQQYADFLQLCEKENRGFKSFGPLEWRYNSSCVQPLSTPRKQIPSSPILQSIPSYGTQLSPATPPPTETRMITLVDPGTRKAFTPRNDHDPRIIQSHMRTPEQQREASCLWLTPNSVINTTSKELSHPGSTENHLLSSFEEYSPVSNLLADFDNLSLQHKSANCQTQASIRALSLNCPQDESTQIHVSDNDRKKETEDDSVSFVHSYGSYDDGYDDGYCEGYDIGYDDGWDDHDDFDNYEHGVT